MKINHLCFADDLTLFCGGDYYSMFMLLKGFAAFSDSSRLMANKSKSEIYVSNVEENVANIIKEASGYTLGKLSFRYLGVPISLKRLIFEIVTF